MKQSQENQILSYLQSGRSLTSMDALVKFGSWRLSARIFRLRQKGYNIKTKIEETKQGKLIARYSLPVNN